MLMSGEAPYRGCPPLSPVKDGSKASVRKPYSAILCAYKPEDRSFTAPNGPLTARRIFRRIQICRQRNAVAIVESHLSVICLSALGELFVPFLRHTQFFVNHVHKFPFQCFLLCCESASNHPPGRFYDPVCTRQPLQYKYRNGCLMSCKIRVYRAGSKRSAVILCKPTVETPSSHNSQAVSFIKADVRRKRPPFSL